MRRPAGAQEALGLSPLVQARWAHSSGLEGVPFVSASTKPSVVLAGRPAAERAADAGAIGVEAFLFVEFAIHRDRLVILDGEHAQ
jgi:hypothetical protein